MHETMPDVRRIIVIFVIAILFTVLINVSIDAFYPQPEYDDFCRNSYPKAMPLEPSKCDEVANVECARGQSTYRYDAKGCPYEAYCETCQEELNQAQKKYNFVVFIVSAIFGLIALVVGLHLPQKKNPINEWVGSGFLLGGLLTILVGTVRYFGDMGRYVRPIVIFIELTLVIYLAYKKL